MDVPGPHHGTVLVVEDEELRGYMAGADEPEWSVPLSEFGWQGEQLVTYNAVTGDPAQPYDLDSSGPLAVPGHITGTGIGVVQVEGELLLAVTD